jgi:hypothetical protein
MNQHADAGIGYGQRGGTDQPWTEIDHVGSEK